MTERRIEPDELVDGVPLLAHERANFVVIGTGSEADHSVHLQVFDETQVSPHHHQVGLIFVKM